MRAHYKKWFAKIFVFFTRFLYDRKGGIGSAFGWIAGVLILSSIAIGFVGISSTFGSVSDMVENMVAEPTSFGAGSVIFFIGFDTWVPAIPKSFLDQYALGWLTWFYPFADGYLPHYSLWSLFFSLVWAFIGTWIIMHIFDLDFFWKGLGIAVVMFIFGWWLWGVIAWQLMHWGGSLIGLSSEQVHELWLGTATAQESEILQYMFIITAIVSAIWGSKKLGGAVL